MNFASKQSKLWWYTQCGVKLLVTWSNFAPQDKQKCMWSKIASNVEQVFLHKACRNFYVGQNCSTWKYLLHGQSLRRPRQISCMPFPKWKCKKIDKNCNFFQMHPKLNIHQFSEEVWMIFSFLVTSSKNHLQTAFQPLTRYNILFAFISLNINEQLNRKAINMHFVIVVLRHKV